MPTKTLKPVLQQQRGELKILLIGLLGNRCEHPNCPNIFVRNPNLHECLVPFNAIKGIDNFEVDSLIALHIANVMLLCNQPCHLNFKPGIAETVEILRKRLKGFYKGFGFQDADDAILDFQDKLDGLYRKGLVKTEFGKFL